MSTSTICISALTGAASAFLIGMLWAPEPRHAPATTTVAAPAPAELGELRAAVEELQRRPGALERVADRAEVPRDAVDVTRAVQQLIETGIVAPGESWVAPEPAWPGGTRNAIEAAAKLIEVGIDSADARALWAAAHEDGRLHVLLASVQEALDAQPDSAETHFQKARAFYAAARTFPSNGKGNWWVDSDKAYAAALERDPQHWEARFQRAVNQSFWPVAYGGQASAIRHFETLLAQQEQSNKQDKFAGTYYWLGNLYDQQGRTDEARAMWRRGLAQHPGDGRLREKLE